VSVLQSDQIVTAMLEALGTELRLDGGFGENVDWLVGFSASFDETSEFHEAYATKNSFNFGPPLIGNPTGIPLLFEKAAQIAATTGESYGGFTTVHWRIADGWALTQGFRYTNELRTYEGCTLEPEDSVGIVGLTNVLNGLSLAGGGTGGAQKGDCFTLDLESNPRLFDGELREDNFSTRTVLEWSPNAESLFYLSYTRGYKAGNFPVVIATTHAAFEPATQERLVAYEGGSKATFLDGFVHADLSAFFYDYADKQLLTYFTDPVFGALPLLRNAPKSSVWGFEASVQWNPLEGLDLVTAASYIDTRVDEFVGTTATGVENDFAGQPFNYAPKIQATGLASYGFDVEDWRLTLGGDVTYADDTNATLEQDPAFAIDSYVLFGARLRITDPSGRWSFLLFGRNLTDELQRTGVFRSGDVVTASAGFPRTYGATVEFRY
jgi:iron complex outermembrane recepter protein